MTLRNHQWLPVAVMALAGALLCHSAPPVHAQEATPEPDGASVVDVVAAFDNVAKWPGWDVIPLIDPTDPTDTARVPFMEAFSSSAPDFLKFKLFVTVSGVEEETLWDSVWWNDDVRQAWDSMATAQGDGAVAQETDATPRANAQVTPTPTRRLCARKLLQAYSDEDAVKDAVGEDSVDDQASPAASPPPLSGCDAEWAALDWVPPPKSSLSCSALDGFTQSYFGKEPIEMLPVNVLSEILLSPGTSAGLPQCHTVYSDCGVPISGPAGQRCAKTVIFEAAAWVQAAIRRFEQDGPWWSSDPQGGDALTFECAGQGVFEGVRFSAGWRLGPIVRIASLQSRGTVIVAAPGSQGDQATPAPTTKGPLVGEAPISVTAAQSTPAGTEESASGAATEQGLETEDSERSEEEAEEGDSNVVEGTRDTEDEAVPSPSSFIAPPTPGPVEEGGVLEAVLSGSVGPGQQVWCVADEALGQIGAGFWTYDGCTLQWALSELPPPIAQRLEDQERALLACYDAIEWGLEGPNGQETDPWEQCWEKNGCHRMYFQVARGFTGSAARSTQEDCGDGTSTCSTRTPTPVPSEVAGAEEEGEDDGEGALGGGAKETFSSVRIELGAPGDFVRPGQVHCVGAGGKMAYDWMAGVAGPIEPESASEDEVEPYFPYRAGSIQGFLTFHIAGWGTPPANVAESQVNAAKQQLVWQVTVDQRATVLARAPLSAPSASASPGLPESLGEPSTGAQAAYFSASTTPASHPDALRVAEAIARVQRRILEDLIPIPDGMYEVRIDEIQGDGPGPEPSAGAVAASAASFPGGRSGTATQLRSSSASYTEGSKAASMRAARMLGGARGRRLASASAPWVPSFQVARAQSVSQQDIALGDGVGEAVFAVRHIVFVESRDEAFRMQQVVNEHRTALDTEWRTALAELMAEAEAFSIGEKDEDRAEETEGGGNSVDESLEEVSEVLQEAGDSILVKTSMVEEPVRVVIPKERLEDLEPPQASGAASLWGWRGLALCLAVLTAVCFGL